MIMKRINELHLEHPAWGSRKRRDRLNIEKFHVNRKRIQRLMHLMNIQTIYPKKKLSIKNNEHKVYPYLLKNLSLDNIMIERFWRALKYEEVYLKDYESVTNAKESIREYIENYNSFRPHENLFGKKNTGYDIFL